MDTNNEEKLLTIGQAAEYLGVSLNTLRRWDESGKLLAIKKDGGTHRYYREKDLDIFKSNLMQFATEWIEKGIEFPSQFYCPTSSIFNARLTKMELALIQKSGFEKLYSLITLITGEIGDNSFAHNLGKWPDKSGIFFGYDLDKRIIVLADRGLGILETLRQVRHGLASHVAAVEVAFTEFISGRSPEKRGNGLKLVREVVLEQPINLYFISGDAEVRMKGYNKYFALLVVKTLYEDAWQKLNFKINLKKYMKLQMEKFGKTLISRELGSEAFKAFQVTLRKLNKNEDLEIDFSGVLTLSPSWADEFLSPLLGQLGDRLVLLPSDNLSVHATLKILGEVNKQPFNVKP